jgi:hypothetical protein
VPTACTVCISTRQDIYDYIVCVHTHSGACASSLLCTLVAQQVEVDASSDPDLLWAMKGAGAAMGVVARIKFRLHDVSDAVTGVMMFPDDPQHKNWR